LITEPQLDLAIREQKRNGGFLGEVLVGLGFVTEVDITNCLAVENDVDVVSIRDMEMPAEVISLVSYDTARTHKVIPLSLSNGVLKVVFADVLNVVAQDAVERETNLTIEVVAAPEAHVLEAIERNYARTSSINETIEQVLSGDSLDVTNADDASPMVRLVDQILATGIKCKATDIHLQPEERNMRVRLRVDGMLREEVIVPKAIQSAVLARIKLMAQMDITEKRVPQDGRIRFTFGSNYVDLRVST
jgi:type IV pilus assembly protein PilB